MKVPAARHLVPLLAVASLAGLCPTAGAQLDSPGEPVRTIVFDCGFEPHTEWRRALRAAVERGEIADPREKRIPRIRPVPRVEPAFGMPPVESSDIHPFEDSAGLLLTDFSAGELIDLMVDAANDLMAAHGDAFDFVGYWVNSTPDHTIGAAFYLGIENDVTGIGLPTFDDRASMGLGGNEIEGFVMMWNVNSSFWQPGTGPDADFTRLAMAQEFEHRFAMFLPDLLDGRRLQGDDSGCGRSSHWSWLVDGQGSGMEISEWVTRQRSGTSGLLGWDATGRTRLKQSFVSFNTDTGGVFSYTDLYLMGYVSPAEMDAGNSELRYVDDSSCGPFHFGPISHFSSADIVAAAGPRVPDSTTAQKDWRAGWVMIHQPGDPPSTTELSKAAAILNQHQEDWFASTLSLGTMDDTLP